MSWAVDGETPKPKTREELLAAIPDNVRSAALAWLQSPVLMSFIAESIELCGVAGEQQTAMLVYLTGTSRLLEHPLAVIVQGPSSSGKSYVIDSVTRLRQGLERDRGGVEEAIAGFQFRPVRHLLR